jgi:hypothetical protein
LDLRGYEFYKTSGAPISGATADIWDAVDGTPGGAPLFTTTTTATGKWEFLALTNTPKDVRVTFTGSIRWYKGLTQVDFTKLFVGSGGISLLGDLSILSSVSRIIPGATSFSVRNSTNVVDNLLVTDAGVVTIRGLPLNLPVQAGGITKAIAFAEGGAGLTSILGNTVGGNPPACLMRFDIANGTSGGSVTALTLDGTGRVTVGAGGLIANLPNVVLIGTATALTPAGTWIDLANTANTSVPAGTYLAILTGSVSTGANADSPQLALATQASTGGGTGIVASTAQVTVAASSATSMTRSVILSIGTTGNYKLQMFTGTTTSTSSASTTCVLVRIA